MSGQIEYQLARRAQDLLGDGQWRPYDEIMAALIKVVPPGVAIRKTEARRQAYHRQRGKEPGKRVRPMPVEDQVVSGAKDIVRDFLRNKAFETDRPGVGFGRPNPERKIRMVATLRVLRGDPYRMERDRLTTDNMRLRDQVAGLVEELTALDRLDLVHRWVPPEEPAT